MVGKLQRACLKNPVKKGSLGAPVDVLPCDLDVTGSSPGSRLLQKCRIRFAYISPIWYGLGIECLRIHSKFLAIHAIESYPTLLSAKLRVISYPTEYNSVIKEVQPKHKYSPLWCHPSPLQMQLGQPT
ncbi:hypothetical protein KSP40_PGU002850 [Platanthera guangdongensis]|uniref:Uncharacterized protein n=1 Tax=Platanthera guangdongensis TaxID=2320717 RepID=A0ABR2N2J4_9ASPA